MNPVSLASPPVSADKHNYFVRPAEVVADQPAIIELWREGGLGGPPGDDSVTARYTWFYRDNPQGYARLSFLWSDRETAPVGFLAMGARTFLVNEKTLAAGVLVDFVVAPNHRFVLPALTLQRDARKQALETLPLIYGLPGAKAVALCKRLPTDVSFGLPRCVRVVRSRYYLDRKLPKIAARFLAAPIDAVDRSAIWLQLLFGTMAGEWVTQFDDSFDDLWNRFPKSGVCIGVRDRRFLQWRFCDKPGSVPRIYAIRDRRTRALQMYFVCELDGNYLWVKDCLHAGSAGDLKRGLLMLAAAARRLGASAVSIEVAGNDSVRRALRRAQYVRRSERPFFALLHPSAADAAKAGSWFITRADEDV